MARRGFRPAGVRRLCGSDLDVLANDEVASDRAHLDGQTLLKKDLKAVWAVHTVFSPNSQITVTVCFLAHF